MKKDSKITYDSVLYAVFNAIYYTPTEQEKQVINDIVNGIKYCIITLVIRNVAIVPRFKFLLLFLAMFFITCYTLAFSYLHSFETRT